MDANLAQKIYIKRLFAHLPFGIVFGFPDLVFLSLLESLKLTGKRSSKLNNRHKRTTPQRPLPQHRSRPKPVTHLLRPMQSAPPANPDTPPSLTPKDSTHLPLNRWGTSTAPKDICSSLRLQMPHTQGLTLPIILCKEVCHQGQAPCPVTHPLTQPAHTPQGFTDRHLPCILLLHNLPQDQ